MYCNMHLLLDKKVIISKIPCIFKIKIIFNNVLTVLNILGKNV